MGELSTPALIQLASATYRSGVKTGQCRAAHAGLQLRVGHGRNFRQAIAFYVRSLPDWPYPPPEGAIPDGDHFSGRKHLRPVFV